jgi:hypothetical protein
LTPALIFALANIVVVLIVDLLFYALPKIFVGGDISESIRKLAALMPWVWRIGYILLTMFLFWHFFEVAP